MLGMGTYFAEHASKSDEYTQVEDTGTTRVLILSRVIIGVPWLEKETPRPGITRPPCIHGHYDQVVANAGPRPGEYTEDGRALIGTRVIPSLCAHKRADSIIAKLPGKCYSEIVVFDRYCAIPELFIEYVRE
jgi:hypothetical protein